MAPLIKKTLPASGGKSRRRRSTTRHDAGEYFAWLLPEKPGWLSDWILKLFYSGVAMDKEQVTTLQRLGKNAVVVFVHKFSSNFEYLFYYSRYRQLQLPYPRVGLDYRIFLWQPVRRIVKFLFFRLQFFLHHQALPDPYERGDIKQQLIDGRCGFLSLVGKKGFYRRFIRARTDPLAYLIDIQKSIDRPVYLIPQLMFFGKAARREHPTIIDILFGPEDKPGRFRRLFTLFKKPGGVFVEVSRRC
jgi:glycerol-3-phosphate O-acyltransferase